MNDFSLRIVTPDPGGLSILNKIKAPSPDDRPVEAFSAGLSPFLYIILSDADCLALRVIRAGRPGIRGI